MTSPAQPDTQAPTQPQPPDLHPSEVYGDDTVKIVHGNGDERREAFVTKQQAEVVYGPLGWAIEEQPASAAAPATSSAGSPGAASTPTLPPGRSAEGGSAQ